MKQAACAEELFASWKWVVEPSAGSEVASTVIQRLEVCAFCPVCRECLADALAERSHTIAGIWGGTTMTERQRTRTTVVRDLNDGATPLELGTDMSGRAFTSRDTHRFEAHDPEVIAETARRLEETFHERYSRWIERDQQGRRERRKAVS